MNPTTASRHTVASHAVATWCRALLIVAIAAFAAPSVVALGSTVEASPTAEASRTEAEHQLHTARRVPVSDVHVASIHVPRATTAPSHVEVTAPPSVDGWQVHEHDRRGPPDLRGPPLRR